MPSRRRMISEDDWQHWQQRSHEWLPDSQTSEDLMLGLAGRRQQIMPSFLLLVS